VAAARVGYRQHKMPLAIVAQIFPHNVGVKFDPSGAGSS
jgi:hypothetical protein